MEVLGSISKHWVALKRNPKEEKHWEALGSTWKLLEALGSTRKHLKTLGRARKHLEAL